MIDIGDIEEGVLIDGADFNVSVENLFNEIRFRGRDMSDDDARRFTCNVIGSLVARDLAVVVKATCRQEDEDLYERLSERDLTPDELDLILKEPSRWEETDVFSREDVYEIAVTDKGRDELRNKI